MTELHFTAKTILIGRNNPSLPAPNPSLPVGSIDYKAKW